MCRTGLGQQHHPQEIVPSGWEAVAVSGILLGLVSSALTKDQELYGILPFKLSFTDEMGTAITYLDEENNQLFVNSDYDNATELDMMRERENRYYKSHNQYWSSAGIVRSQHPMKSYIDHEIGHAIYKNAPPSKQAKWESSVRNALRKGWKPPTKYSNKSYKEMWAEMFVLKKNGYDYLIDREMNKVMDSILSRE